MARGLSLHEGLLLLRDKREGAKKLCSPAARGALSDLVSVFESIKQRDIESNMPASKLQASLAPKQQAGSLVNHIDQSRQP